MYDYSKLSGKIVENFGTRYEFANAMGWSERTLSLKMSGKRDWRQRDIRKAVKILNLSNDDIPIYFFKQIVQKN